MSRGKGENVIVVPWRIGESPANVSEDARYRSRYAERAAAFSAGVMDMVTFTVLMQQREDFVTATPDALMLQPAEPPAPSVYNRSLIGR